MSELIPFDNGEDGFFIKFFLLDASTNLNRWAVTESALRDNLPSFIGKPFVLTPDFGHPDAANGDDLFKTQEEFRIGEIISVGIENDTSKAWGIAELSERFGKNSEDKERIREGIKNIREFGNPSFVSPSVVFNERDIILQNNAEFVTKFEGAHVAAVKDPAYEMQKAQIKGKCNGSAVTCNSQLSKVQASVEQSPCGKFLTRRNESSVDIFDSNIDPESLDEITVIDIPQKKKKKENCSLSDKSNSTNLMSTNKAQDEEKEEEQSNLEELEEERKERKDEQAQDEDKEEKEDSEEKDEEKKDSKKAIRELQKELKSLKAQYNLEKLTPVINKIVEAKVTLGRISDSERQSEFDRLASARVEDLKAWSAEYEGLVKGNQKPYTKYKLQASRDSSSKDFDGLILQMREGVN